ncbi:MAG: murein L,D-transpeptidase catalytic domain family protein [Gammaproteobacteria bacterium]
MKSVLCIFAFLGIVGWGPFNFLFGAPSTNLTPTTQEWINDQARRITAQATNIDRDVLKLSLAAYIKARQHGINRKSLLTVVDYSRPSTERRLWVIDLTRSKVLFNTWVTHGYNSGKVNATRFSNEMNSLKSSLGVFVTENSYTGTFGYSLRIHGLESGINDNAYRRSIVFHGAWYASPDVARRKGMLGRSFGCLAVNPTLSRSLIDTIKDRSLVVVYYPDRYWLTQSQFLNYREA